MATRRPTPPDDATTSVPAELWWGLPPDSTPWFGAEDPRSTVAARTRRLWTGQVQAAGWTVTALRKAAETDPAYQDWLVFRARKRRIAHFRSGVAEQLRAELDEDTSKGAT